MSHKAQDKSATVQISKRTTNLDRKRPFFSFERVRVENSTYMLLPVGTEAFRDAQSFDVVRERKKKLVKREVSHPILLRFDGKS